MKNMLSKDLKVITSEIYEYDRKERNSVFEIGKRFKHVKENDLTNGQYKEWVKDLGYTSRTEERYRKVYERFGSMKEAENFRVSKLFEMTSINESVDIKAFLSKTHKINGKLKTVEQMTKLEIRDLVKATNETISPKKATPASPQTKDFIKNIQEFLETRNSSPIEKELLKELFEYFEDKLVQVFELSDEQRKELLNCCKDESYNQELSVLLKLIEDGLTHVQINNRILS